jgi:DnaD/phage-associated family protein
MKFYGFSEGQTRSVRIPEQFFRELLLGMDDAGELRLVLYIFWRLEHMEGNFRYLRWSSLLADQNLLESYTAPAALKQAVDQAIERGILLSAYVPVEESQERLLFLNNARGQAALQAIERGDWRLTGDARQPLAVYTQRPNIFQLYESNIGTLTPMIAEALQDAEKTYPAEWIEDAIRISVENNKRNWRYVEAILKRWQEGGRDGKKKRTDRESERESDTDRRDSAEARRRYGEWDQERRD